MTNAYLIGHRSPTKFHLQFYFPIYLDVHGRVAFLPFTRIALSVKQTGLCGAAEVHPTKRNARVPCFLFLPQRLLFQQTGDGPQFLKPTQRGPTPYLNGRMQACSLTNRAEAYEEVSWIHVN